MSHPDMHCVEVATFKLKAGATDAELFAVEKRIRSGVMIHQPGYLGRELAKNEETGDWLMILRFETRVQMDAWMVNLKQYSEMREMGGLIDMSTMSMHFFLHRSAGG